MCVWLCDAFSSGKSIPTRRYLFISCLQRRLFGRWHGIFCSERILWSLLFVSQVHRAFTPKCSNHFWSKCDALAKAWTNNFFCGRFRSCIRFLGNYFHRAFAPWKLRETSYGFFSRKIRIDLTSQHHFGHLEMHLIRFENNQLEFYESRARPNSFVMMWWYAEMWSSISKRQLYYTENVSFVFVHIRVSSWLGQCSRLSLNAL